MLTERQVHVNSGQDGWMNWGSGLSQGKGNRLVAFTVSPDEQ
jgi:hypothetical protein